MALTASHCKFTSPANSVLMSSVLASDLDDRSCQPVPILERYLVRHHAPRGETQHPVTQMLWRTRVLLRLNFTDAVGRGLLGKGAGLLFLASFPAKSVKSTVTTL
jgi:hypothetical protein